MEPKQFLKGAARCWTILEQLHRTNSAISLSELAKQVNMHISNVSRDIDTLEKLEPKLIEVHEQERDQGGRPFKLVSLNDVGKTLVQTVISATEVTPPASRFSDIQPEEIAYVINEIREPKSQETKEAAWTELHGIARSTRLWKHKQVWSLIEVLLSTETPNQEGMNALNLLHTLLHLARVELSTKNEVETKTKQQFYPVLRRILERVSVEWSPYRYQVIAIFDYLMTDSEKFRESWRIWEKGLEEIKDEGQFTGYLQPVLPYITSANLDQKKSVKQKLYQLMQSPEPLVRKRALNMHSTLFR